MLYRISLVSLTLALACGGGPSRPGPLKTTVDDMYLASVDMSEKNAVLSAQNAYSKAKMEFANAQNKYEESKTKIRVARNDLKKAKIERQSAKANKQDAKRKAMVNEMKGSERELKIADARVSAGKSKIDAWKAYKKAYNKKKLWAEESMFSAEAKYELAKARLAKNKGISPPGFEFAKFEKQAEDRSRRAQKRKSGVDKALAKAKQKWDKYKSIEAKAVKAGGGSSD